MSSPNSAAALPLAAAVSKDLVEDDQPDSGPTVGASDADADAARSGGDVELTNPTRDSDGTPVGEADRDADIERAGSSDS
jgi:hypothetical protein